MMEGRTEKREAKQGHTEGLRKEEGKRNGSFVGATETSKEIAEWHRLW